MHYLGTPVGTWWSWPYDINDAGMMVGISLMITGPPHAFVWDGVMHDIGEGTAYHVNNAGQVVGNPGPFLWADGIRHDLGILSGTPGSVGSGFWSRAINNAGQVVGTSTAASGQSHAILWRVLTPVEHLESCAALVSELEAQDVLNKGQAQSFVNKINVATAMLNDGKNTPAINILEAFQDEASGYVNGQNITPEQGEELVSCVQVVIDNAGGS